MQLYYSHLDHCELCKYKLRNVRSAFRSYLAFPYLSLSYLAIMTSSHVCQPPTMETQGFKKYLQINQTLIVPSRYDSYHLVIFLKVIVKIVIVSRTCPYPYPLSHQSEHIPMTASIPRTPLLIPHDLLIVSTTQYPKMRCTANGCEKPTPKAI